MTNLFDGPSFEDVLTGFRDLSEERSAPLYRDFSPSERERIFQAWVREMSVDDAVELQEVTDKVFENSKAAWKQLITGSGDPRPFTDVYRLLLDHTNFPLLDEAIEEVWEKHQPVMSFMHREQAS